MSIAFACQKCGSRYKVADDQAGKKGQCPKCGAAFQLPTLESLHKKTKAAAPPPPAATAPPARRRAPSPELNDLARAATVSRREHRREHVEQVHTRHTDQTARSGHGREKKIAPGRPFGPEREAKHRRRNLTLIGCALLIGTVLPVIVPTPSETTVSFLNFEILAQPGVPVVLKILMLYPLLAGVGLAIGALMLGAGGARAGWCFFLPAPPVHRAS